MIDELPTRAAMTVASFLLLASGLSLMSVFGADAARDAADALARHLARSLDEVGQIDGLATFRGGVGVAGSFGIPPTLAGSPYRLAIASGAVRVTVGSFVAVAPLRIAVHPFSPDRDAYSADDLRTRDGALLSPGEGMAFVVERAERLVDGAPSVLTFVHLP